MGAGSDRRCDKGDEQSSETRHSGEETRARDTCRNSASYCSRTERGQEGEKQKAESHNGRVQRLDHEKDLQDPFSRQLEGEPQRKAAFCPSDFPSFFKDHSVFGKK